MNFDSIADVVDQYFKIARLKDLGLTTVEIEDYLIAEVEKNRTAYAVIEEMYIKDKSEVNRKLFEAIYLIEKENPSSGQPNP